MISVHEAGQAWAHRWVRRGTGLVCPTRILYWNGRRWGDVNGVIDRLSDEFGGEGVDALEIRTGFIALLRIGRRLTC